MIILTQDGLTLIEAQTIRIGAYGASSYTLWALDFCCGSASKPRQVVLAEYGAYAEAKEALKYIAERLNAGDTVVEL